jgi:hypothetical protein
MPIEVDLEEWSGSSVIHRATATYKRQPAELFRDLPASLTPRQAVFYRNLIRIALAGGSNRIPVDFQLANGERLFLDKGCVKIAEHAGFIRPLENNASGVVEHIVLAWDA